MKADILARWLAALQSGAYAPLKGAHRQVDINGDLGYDPVGVLATLAEGDLQEPLFTRLPADRPMWEVGDLQSLVDWAGVTDVKAFRETLSLAVNAFDEGAAFPAVAHLIKEKELVYA